jgi:hypothetical protein
MDMWTGTKLADAMTGPDRVRRRHPTQWWRYHLAQDYDARTVRRLRGCLAKFEVAREARWFEAATGDAAAAIGMAFKYRPTDSHRMEFDLAMTALTVCAVRGSTASRIVMAKMLRWLPDGAAPEIRVADSWLMLAYAAKTAGRNADSAP